MVDDDIFRLGDITQEDYQDMIKKESLMHILESSVMELWDYASAFLPWMGTCPVANYAVQENMVPKIHCSAVHKIYTAQLSYIFEKIEESKKNLQIFKKWININTEVNQ